MNLLVNYIVLLNVSIIFLSEHTGGYRKGSGHGKSGWYKGIYCDSSWELAYDNLNPNIKNISNKNISWFYKVNDKNKTYVNAFITDKEDFDYYINNDWNIGRVPINVFIDYKNVRYKSERKILRKIKKEDKEKYLSSLL